MTSHRSLIVVGAGVFGASLARHCALAGWDVTLVERVAPGHVRAGSGDESRLIRCVHGADAWHTALGAARVGAVARDRPVAGGARGHGLVRPPRRRLGGRQRADAARAGHPVRARRRRRAVPVVRRRRRALDALRARGGHPARPRRDADARGAGGGGRGAAAPGRGAARRRGRGARRRHAAGGRSRRLGLRGLAAAAVPRRAVAAHHPAGRLLLRRRRGVGHPRRARLGRLRRRRLRPGRPRRPRREGRARRRGARGRPRDLRARRGARARAAGPRVPRAIASRPWPTRRWWATAPASTS